MFSSHDRDRLRKLAQQQLEIHNSPVNQARIALWKRHNAFRGTRPMIHIELDTFADELIPARLECESPDARRLETELLQKTINLTEFDDDWVVPDYFGVEWEQWFRPFGWDVRTETAEDANGNRLGHCFVPVIEDLEQDEDKLRPSDFGVDKEATRRHMELAQEAFVDILPVKMIMSSPPVVLTQQIVHLMGMENMYIAMMDDPERFAAMMDRLAEDYLRFFAYLAENDCLYPTTGFELLRQGSLCFTEELPSTRPASVKEMWGFMDSQETVSVSPQMFHELIFPSYKKVADAFGLLSYGCCEPVSAVWDDVSTLTNLRKVSISPWCDEVFMGEQLRGRKTVFHRKPSPNFLGLTGTLDEAAIREHFDHTLQAARGCTLEFTQRDVYTVQKDPARVRRYVQLLREEIETHWQG